MRAGHYVTFYSVYSYDKEVKIQTRAMNNDKDFFCLGGNAGDDYINWQDIRVQKYSGSDYPTFVSSDEVNSPSHYTQGKTEAIDVIEDAIKDAPTTKTGFLQGQVLKYLLRLWHKGKSKQDAEKARWYLNRLIDLLD